MHPVTRHGHEQVLIFDVPQDMISLCLEVWNHNQTFVDGVEHVAMACTVDADALCAGLVRENFLKGVLTLVLQDEGLVINQVVTQLATLVDQEQEGVDNSDLDDGRIPISKWEPDIGRAFILNQVE